MGRILPAVALLLQEEVQKAKMWMAFGMWRRPGDGNMASFKGFRWITDPNTTNSAY